MNLLYSVLLLTLVLFVHNTASHKWWKKKSWVVNPFTSGMCRLRHFKTILNKYNNVVACKRTCPTNYIEKYSLHWGHHCKPVDIPVGCADQYCIRCATGYKYKYTYPYTKRCVKSCSKGYVENGNSCVLCTIRNCDECASMWTCKKCSRNLILHKDYFGQTKCVYFCPRNYNKVTINGSYSCVKKGRMTTEKPIVTTEEPIVTTEMLIATTEKTDKDLIIPDFITEEPTTVSKIDATNASEPAIIPTTTTTKTTTTTTKQPVFPYGCSDEFCVICQPGYFKYYPQTKGSYCLEACPTGHTALGSLCVACSDRRCASCKTSMAECDRCYPGYSMLLDSFNITLECVRNCPKGYKLDIVDDVRLCLKTPEPECSVANCARCITSLYKFHHGCSECMPGFTLFRGTFNDHCYKTCPPGFYKSTKPGTNITACAKCLTPFCNKCSDANVCTECIEPMVLDSTAKYCTTCPSLTTYSFKHKLCIEADFVKPENDNSIFIDDDDMKF